MADRRAPARRRTAGGGLRPGELGAEVGRPAPRPRHGVDHPVAAASVPPTTSHVPRTTRPMPAARRTSSVWDDSESYPKWSITAAMTRLELVKRTIPAPRPRRDTVMPSVAMTTRPRSPAVYTHQGMPRSSLHLSPPTATITRPTAAPPSP